MLKTILYVFLSTLVAGCFIVNPDLECENFTEFKNSFNDIDSSFAIDSLDLHRLMTTNNYSIVSKSNSVLTKDSLFSLTCGNTKKYIFKRVGKIEAKKSIAIIYLVELSEDCIVDAHELYFRLCIYDDCGVLQFSDTIGELYEVFGHSVFKTFHIESGDKEPIITIRTVKEVMDDSNPGYFVSDVSYRTISFANF